MTPLSIEVIGEMIRTIKEEQLPSLQRQLEKMNGQVDELQAFKNAHDGEIKGIKFIGGVVTAGITLAIGAIALFK